MRLLGLGSIFLLALSLSLSSCSEGTPPLNSGHEAGVTVAGSGSGAAEGRGVTGSMLTVRPAGDIMGGKGGLTGIR